MRFKFTNSVRQATLAVAVVTCTGYVCLLPAVADTGATDSRFAKAPGTDEYPLANALYLQDDLSYTVNPDGSTRFYEHDVIKVLNNKGVRLYNSVMRNFDSRYEEVKVIKAQTITPEGKVLPVPETSIITTPALDSPLYENRKWLTIEFPHCVTSAIVEYELATIRKSNACKYWWQGSFMENLDPILHSKFTLSVPQGAKFSSYVAPDIKAAPKTSQEGQDVYVWSRDSDGTYTPEPSAPDAMNYLKTVEASSVGSWDELARWYGSVWDEAVKHTDKFGLKLTSISSNSKPKKQRIQDVLDWIAKNYTTELSTALGPDLHTPNELLDAKTIGSNDAAVLTAAVLKQYGIDAYPVLSSEFSADGNLPKRTPTLDRFSRLLLRVMGDNGNDWWIDPVQSTLVCDSPPESSQNKYALFLASADQKPELKCLGSSKSTAYMRDIRLDILVDDRNADIALNLTLSGEIGDQWRALLLGAKDRPSNEKENLFNYLAQALNTDFAVPASFYSYYFPEKVELGAPLTLSTTTMSAGLASSTPDHEYSMPVAIYGGDRLTSLLTNQTKRKKPIDLGHPFIDEIRTHVELPATATITSIPKDIQVETPCGSFRCFTRQQGREIWQYSRIEVKEGLIETKDMAKIMPLVKAQSECFNSLLKFTMPPAPKKDADKSSKVDEADKTKSPDKASEVDKADKASTPDKAGKADKASAPDKAGEADKADKASTPDKASAPSPAPAGMKVPGDLP